MNFITLNNNTRMPQMGFGVAQMEDDVAESAVTKALETGYTSIDTAMLYNNEKGVGRALQNSSVAREDLFITTKVWNSDQGYDSTLRAFDESLERLGLDTVDLYLIHWPAPEFNLYIDTYKAMEKLVSDGRIKAIGVSNFEIEHLERLLAECDVPPTVNQVECHPYLAQNELKEYCAKHDIAIEAWSPLDQGSDVLQDETIRQIATSHGKTTAQAILRWHIQNGTIVIPKSATPARIEENFDIFNFELSSEEMSQINALNKDRRKGPHPNDMHGR